MDSQSRAGLPIRGQTGSVGVGHGDPVEPGQPEQVQHRQVGLPVAAVRGRIYQHHTGTGVEDVAGPQVAVDAGRWRAVVELPACQPAGHGLEDAGLGPVVPQPLLATEGEHGQDALLGEELAPRRGRPQS